MAEAMGEDTSHAEMTAVFENAAKYLGSIVGELETDQLLYFYARFKQVRYFQFRLSLKDMFTHGDDVNKCRHV